MSEMESVKLVNNELPLHTANVFSVDPDQVNPAADYFPDESLLKVPRRVKFGGDYDPWTTFTVLIDGRFKHWACCLWCLREHEPCWVHRPTGNTRSMEIHNRNLHNMSKHKVFLS